ncbi:hypothetical protein OHS33_04810 [Streptomyces sp. NBC_00536]|uniref:hypothetical protein n=1 Tax=Streptomyces sp. NBC_00536 TaxID=2975769 RepID=UPI002E81BB75|nr:hypothetical protein [Streptomyces sp. NBC_00536]WUC77718.1 hypothetical protein OHS33_04810 [Streptomyces sp. NBC_00536]
MADEQAAPEAADLGEIQSSNGADTSGIQQIPAQLQVQESPTVAVARERLVEAIGREAAFLVDQRAGQASAGLESLARAFSLVVSGPMVGVTASQAEPITAALHGRYLEELSPPNGSPIGDDYVVTDVPKPIIRPTTTR